MWCTGSVLHLGSVMQCIIVWCSVCFVPQLLISSAALVRYRYLGSINLDGTTTSTQTMNEYAVLA